MKIGISTFLFPDWSLEQVAQYVAALGYEMVEWRFRKELRPK